MNDWFEAEQRIERAQQLSESLRWEEALAEIDVALSIDPNHATWHAQRGCILEELGRWDEAVSAYEAALELGAAEPEIAAALGATLCRVGWMSRALEVFEDLAERHPDFEPAYCHRIDIYTELGRHDQAEEVFYLAQELNDSCPHCFYYIGSSLAARGKTDRALYCWHRVLAIDPDYLGVNRRIAQAYRSQRQLAKARDYYLRELRSDPGNTDLLFEIAELMIESKRIEDAAAKFAQIIELDPDHIEAHTALGRVWLVLNQPGKALASFELVSSITDGDPGLPGFESSVGEALFQIGRFSQARSQLKLSVDREGGTPETLALLGDCLLAMRRPDEAADAYRRVLALDTSHSLAQYKLGMCLCSVGSYKSGLEHLIKAIRFRPEYGPAMQAAVVAQLRLGLWPDARAMLRRALRNDPHNPELRRLARPFWRHRLRHLSGKLLAAFKQSHRGAAS